MDLLALRRWSVPGIALAGTAIRDEMLVLLDHFDRVYVALDSDAGGRAGVERIARHLGPRAVCVQLPPEVNDVADLARLPDGEELFRAAILAAVDSTSEVLPPHRQLPDNATRE